MLRLLASFEVFSAVVAAAVEVALRRFRNGRARPSWSFMHELVAAVMKRQFADLSRRPWDQQRRGWDARRLPDPTWWRTRRRRSRIGGVSCVVVEPRFAEPARTILFLHGGAYCLGAMEGYREVFGRLALAARARLVAPDYRLAPEHPFPSAVEDAFAVYRALVGEVEPASLVVSGDSAGGGLAAATMLRARDASVPLPAAAILLSPWVDLGASAGTLETHEPFDFFSPALVARWAELYLGGASATEPLASPRHADLGGLPPTLVLVGGAEMILDQVRAFAERARAAGTECTLEEWTDMFHDWFVFPSVFRASRAALLRAASFAKLHTPELESVARWFPNGETVEPSSPRFDAEARDRTAPPRASSSWPA